MTNQNYSREQRNFLNQMANKVSAKFKRWCQILRQQRENMKIFLDVWGFSNFFLPFLKLKTRVWWMRNNFSKIMFFFPPWKQKEFVCSSDVFIVCNNAAFSQKFLNSSILLILVQVVLNSSENLAFYVNWAIKFFDLKSFFSKL